jgi:hypothetical protein
VDVKRNLPSAIFNEKIIICLEYEKKIDPKIIRLQRNSE